MGADAAGQRRLSATPRIAGRAEAPTRGNRAWVTAVRIGVPGLALVALCAGIASGKALAWRVHPTSAETVFLTSTQPSDSQLTSAVGPTAPQESSPAATRVCEKRLAQYAGPDNAMQVSLVAAYASTAGDVAADDERRQGGRSQSSWRGRSASEFEAVCFFDAPIFGVAPRASSGPASPPPGYDRLEEIVRPDGVPVVYVAGFRRTLPVRPVPHSSAS